VGVNVAPGVEVTLRLKHALEVTGRVVDEDEQVVEGARVTLRPEAVRRGRSGIDPGLTDAQGHFTIRGVPAGDVVLFVDHPGFKPAQRKTRIDGVEASHHFGDVTLTRGIGIEGRVVDDAGLPQAGLTVNANHIDSRGVGDLGTASRTTEERRWASAVTDAGGAFAFYGLKEGDYRLQASGSGIYSEQPEIAAGSTDVTLVVRRAASLKLRVISTDGEPVARAAVNARLPDSTQRRGFLAFAYTDDRGRATLHPLPPTDPFDLEIRHGAHKLFRELGVRTSRDAKEVRLDAGARLRGMVVDGEGKPVPSMRVSAAAGTDRGSARTDGEGRFEIGGLDVEPYEVRVGTARTGYIASDPITATPGKGDLRLVVIKGESIRGRVVDTAGNPVRQIQVRAVDAAGNDAGTAWVWRMGGEFELTGLPKGSYVLRFLRGSEVKAELSTVATGTNDLKVTIPD
jgi:protocatechuate 3,4-dioxygenase beta subunit